MLYNSQGDVLASSAANVGQTPTSKRQRERQRQREPPADDVIDLTNESSQPDDCEIISCTVVSEPQSKRMRVFSNGSTIPSEKVLLRALQDRYRIATEDIITKEKTPVGPSCGICMERMGGDTSRPMFGGPCGHVYCKTCLFEAIQKTKKCPTCRKTLSTKQLHPVFINFGS